MHANKIFLHSLSRPSALLSRDVLAPERVVCGILRIHVFTNAATPQASSESDASCPTADLDVCAAPRTSNNTIPRNIATTATAERARSACVTLRHCADSTEN